jgi:hypothetical protein
VEEALRRWATRFDPDWHRAESRRGGLFGNSFHTALAGGLSPGAVGQIERGLALAAAGDAAAALGAFWQALLAP